MFLIRAKEKGQVEDSFYITPSNKDQLLQAILDNVKVKGKKLGDLLKELFNDEPLVADIAVYVFDEKSNKYEGHVTIIENTISDIYLNKMPEGDYFLVIPIKLRALDKEFELDRLNEIIPIGVRKKINFNIDLEQKKEEPKVEPKNDIEGILTKHGYTIIKKDGLTIGKKIVMGVPVYVVLYSDILDNEKIATFLGKLELLGISPNIKIFHAKEVKAEPNILKTKGIFVVQSLSEIDAILYSLSNANEKITKLKKYIEVFYKKFAEYESKLHELKEIAKQIVSL
ncbi:NEQ476 [Nanoarchaeum equitans Kin4-M]|uniref:NEQ476 n=1 Tax=Nanoarchaeum equitans (strain Kin4-M) TaxID=228908 RepID=Q74MZ9_NANEQ|nr:NEQ476 [Nanoarchaeum equitans Kin4-M]